ncbi:unnamed protein product [Gemmata massiliana]|uniref:Uncharacterized protein n=1 Tax=Gemmata massiliana TaxID=1210884 RepID=A0A6P2DCD3_9BACT|nr:unnamed protein product [Gemmata massiliana]
MIPGALTHELRDNDDSRGVHGMLWGFVWVWAFSLVPPLVSTVILIFWKEPTPSGSNDLPLEPREPEGAADELDH